MKELSNDVILRAIAGEADALQEVLACFEPYINTLPAEFITSLTRIAKAIFKCG